MGRPGGAPENMIPCQPGQSGNPAGRPKGSRGRVSIYRDILEAKAWKLGVPEIKDLLKNLGAPKSISVGDLLALKTVVAAFKDTDLGMKATVHSEDSGYGKIAQRTEVTGADGESLLKEQADASLKGLSVDQLKKIQAIISEPS